MQKQLLQGPACRGYVHWTKHSMVKHAHGPGELNAPFAHKQKHTYKPLVIPALGHRTKQGMTHMRLLCAEPGIHLDELIFRILELLRTKAQGHCDRSMAWNGLGANAYTYTHTAMGSAFISPGCHAAPPSVSCSIVIRQLTQDSRGLMTVLFTLSRS